MRIKWTSKAMRDLSRLHGFLVEVNPSAAARVVQALTNAPVRLSQNPRLGIQLFEFEGREVRRILAGPYEVRYEIRNDTVYVLRLFHSREHR